MSKSVWECKEQTGIKKITSLLKNRNMDVLIICRRRVLLIVTTLAALAGAATASLEDLEFHVWKLKFGEKFRLSNQTFQLVCKPQKCA